MPLIDVHTHIGQFAASRQSADGATLSAMLQFAGITQALAFSAEACYGGIELGNRYTMQEVSKHEMLKMLLVLHPHHYKNSVQLLQEFAGNPKVVGVKLHPHLGGYHVLDTELIRLIDEEIAPRELTILSHVGNDAVNVQPRDFLRLAAQFPQTRFVAAHLASGVLGNRHSGINAWREFEPKNVWMDMATLRAFHTGILEEYVQAVGEDRICFGTDAPLYWPVAFASVLQTVDLDAETREKIAWKNARQAFPRLTC
jgi:predicted TIM-barrel fold metal-dependent hydrolase